MIFEITRAGSDGRAGAEVGLVLDLGVGFEEIRKGDLDRIRIGSGLWSFSEILSEQ